MSDENLKAEEAEKPATRTAVPLPAGIVQGVKPSADGKIPTAPSDLSGAWSLRSLKDTRENVIEQINGALTVPEEVKAFLVAAINQSHAKARLICVDAHCQVVQLPRGGVKHMGFWDISEI